MTNKAIYDGGRASAPGQLPRVYCEADPQLRLADGTPLYLEWIVEPVEGQLYSVPAEADGWLRRRLYRGRVDTLKPVPALEAGAVVRHTGADFDPTGGPGYRFEHQALPL